MGNYVYAHLEPIMALRLAEPVFNATTFETGFCLSIYGLVYMIGCFLVPYIPERIPERLILMFSVFFTGIFLFI